MKRLILLAAGMVLLASAHLFAIGLGPQVNFNPEFSLSGDLPTTWGTSLSLKTQRDSSWAFAFGFNVSSYTYDTDDYWYNERGKKIYYEESTDIYTLNATADKWLFGGTIKPFWHWFAGFGASASFSFTSNGDNVYFSAGPRGVGGMVWNFVDNFLELYAQGAVQPEIGLAIGDDGSWNGVLRMGIYFPFNAGLRFWF